MDRDPWDKEIKIIQLNHQKVYSAPLSELRDNQVIDITKTSLSCGHVFLDEKNIVEVRNLSIDYYGSNRIRAEICDFIRT